VVPPESGGAEPKGRRQQSSRYLGVCWHKATCSWFVQLYDTQTKHQHFIGCYTSEEDAARAYDFAAVQAHGPGGRRNFPDEDITEVPATAGEKRKQHISSRYVGVSWHKATSSWQTRTKRTGHIGRFTSEEDAARAYDCAAVQAHGPGGRRNFPGETVSELPVSKGEEYKQGKTSRFLGVYWNKGSSSWKVQLTEPLTKRSRYVGRYASEEDAARAYDFAAVQAHGPGTKRNFPGETVSEPAAVGEKRKECGSSRYLGVTWHKAKSSFYVQLWDPQTKRTRHVGSYTSQEDAARAYDFAAVQAHGPGVKRNFPGEAISELPVSKGEERKQRSS
jgi:hypothetical protein